MSDEPASPAPQKRPKVFISYSHQDEAWKRKLLPQLQALEQAGVPMAVWHDRKIDGGDKWYPEIQEAMAQAAVAVLLISPDFLASGFINKEEVPFLLNRQEKHGMLLLPVLVRPCVWKAHRWLKDRQMIPRDGKCVAIDFPDPHADGVFSTVADAVYRHFEQLAAQPQKASSLPAAVKTLAQAEVAKLPGQPGEPPSVPIWPEVPKERVDLSHLPETGSALFGRDEELTLLDQVWSGEQQPGDGVPTRVLAFKAQGGVGKSTLINHWLEEMRRDQFRGASRVFGWSFYSQGVREHGAPSADAFVAAALRFFGDEAMAGSSVSAWEKGERLARLVGTERALLVLDGMEPLQSAQEFQRGKLQDPALESLLRGLARHSMGLCIITTREPLADLGKKAGIVERDLEQITPQAGRALLRALQVVGTDAELEALAGRFGPHALAISLLGVYLHEQPGRRVGPAQELEKLPGQTSIDRVLAGFEQWLGKNAELDALQLLGLFDRPADEGCLRALREQSAIAGLTESIAGLADSDWYRVLTRLKQLRLVHIRQSESGKRFVDTHPLIREHFAARVREQNSDAWRAAHRRLYEHLCKHKEGDQPTLEDLQPLYQAVAHGCQAGLQQEAREKLYRDRIQRGGEAYSTRKLGAVGSDLGAVAHFFERPWSHVSSSLTEAAQSWLLSRAACDLRALGRLTESRESMRAALEITIRRGDWRNAAIDSYNLSELELMLGKVTEAVGHAEQSVTYADSDGGAFYRMAMRTAHADAMHQAGRQVEAEKLFREAEQMQTKQEPDARVLYSVRGFKYCDLLLASAERAAWQTILFLQPRPSTLNLSNSYREVSERAAQTLEWACMGNGQGGLLDPALDHLTVGRTALYEALSGVESGIAKTKDDTARLELNMAVADLRRARRQDYLPRGLLARAWQRFVTGVCAGLESAKEDLDEAWEIAERGPMRLFMADIHLYRARLFGSPKAKADGVKYPWESAAKDLAEAERFINECGYHRRDEELADAKKAILGG